MKKILFRKLLMDYMSFFLIALLSSSIIIWVFQAVNYLDIMIEDGRSFLVYTNYTLLSFPKIISKIIELSNKYNLKIFGDTQCSSQIGLVTKFRNFTLLCPNEKEARIALQDKESGLESIITKLLSITNSEMLIMKLGAQGFVAAVFHKAFSASSSLKL